MWLERQRERRASVELEMYRHLRPVKGVPRLNAVLFNPGFADDSCVVVMLDDVEHE